jgi:hypothetical protein
MDFMLSEVFPLSMYFYLFKDFKIKCDFRRKM